MVNYADFTFFPNPVSWIFQRLFATLCFRLRRLNSLSFIYYPGEGGREKRGREGDACPALLPTEPDLGNLEHLSALTAGAALPRNL